MTIQPLIDATRLGRIINYISSLTFLPQVLKLLILTFVTSLFDAYNSLFLLRQDFVEQAERYIQSELDLGREKGRVAIVTGGNTGIGYVTAKYLAKAGYRVIIGCRDSAKVESAIQKLKAELKDVNVEYIKLDLASFQSVRNFAEEFKKRNLSLHIMINNAGVLTFSSSEVTVDGHELHFQVNYLSNFLLVDMLLPCLSNGDSRVIFLGSLVHYGAEKFSLENFQPKPFFDPCSGYLNSKLAVTIFAHALSAKLKKRGTFVGVADPGTTATELFRSIPLPSWFWSYFMRPAEAGALTVLKLAIDSFSDPNPWLYYMAESPIQPKNIALDPDFQDALWNFSSNLTSDS